MPSAHRARAVTLVCLAFLAWLPAALLADCGIVCAGTAKIRAGAARSGHSCCRHGSAAAVRSKAACCETTVSTVPVETPRATAPSSPLALTATPVELPGEPVTPAAAALPLADPPPLHEGVGLYTLHSTFLI